MLCSCSGLPSAFDCSCSPSCHRAEANAWIHRQTTGPELVRAMEGKPFDYFVCAYGTGGTLKGVGQVLRQERPETKVVLCEPANAPILLSGVKTDYKEDGSITDKSHPVFRPHLLQGWTPDFVPRMVEDATQAKYYDELCHVSGDEAVQTSQALARTEGIFTGTSGGGVLAVALRKARTLSTPLCGIGARPSVVVMLPDTGERYLSTPLFDGVPADMTDEEKELAKDAPPTTAFPQELPEPSDDGRALVKAFIGSASVAVVAMESCEFCWCAAPPPPPPLRREAAPSPSPLPPSLPSLAAPFLYPPPVRPHPGRPSSSSMRSASATRSSTSTRSSTRPTTRATSSARACRSTPGSSPSPKSSSEANSLVAPPTLASSGRRVRSSHCSRRRARSPRATRSGTATVATPLSFCRSGCPKTPCAPSESRDGIWLHRPSVRGGHDAYASHFRRAESL